MLSPQDIIIELQRISGALEGIEEQLACVCAHFGAPRLDKPKATKRERVKRAKGEVPR